jgi:hypothetical protein
MAKSQAGTGQEQILFSHSVRVCVVGGTLAPLSSLQVRQPHQSVCV